MFIKYSNGSFEYDKYQSKSCCYLFLSRFLPLIRIQVADTMHYALLPGFSEISFLSLFLIY